jgi:hypothetical protein
MCRGRAMQNVRTIYSHINEYIAGQINHCEYLPTWLASKLVRSGHKCARDSRTSKPGCYWYGGTPGCKPREKLESGNGNGESARFSDEYHSVCQSGPLTRSSFFLFFFLRGQEARSVRSVPPTGPKPNTSPSPYLEPNALKEQIVKLGERKRKQLFLENTTNVKYSFYR